MSQPTLDMMAVRRMALDAMADLPGPPTGHRPLTAIRLDLAEYKVAEGSGAQQSRVQESGVQGSGEVSASLVDAVTDLLVRDDGTNGAGAAVVTGVSRYFDLPVARLFHEVLFRRVWDRFRHRCGRESPGDHFQIKINVTSDGAIPLELYGSEWSFKQLHMDRDALLFSHLYGPVAGFTGGALLLADVRTYLHRHGLRFDDLFEWSKEATPGSKPVLRAEHLAAVMAECGVDIGSPGPDEIIFVNNLPSAGILHGVTPVALTAEDRFVRTFHRCSVKGVPWRPAQPA